MLRPAQSLDRARRLLLAAGVAVAALRSTIARAEDPPRKERSRRRVRPKPYETRVTGDAQRKRESAEAVTVVVTDRAKRESADLGAVLNRIPGVAIARTGGLGSDVRFSLNGLTNDQIRFFLNGVPLEIAGFAFGLTNVPVNLVDQVEVYRGVVPIRFGADALGGAVNLVTGSRYFSSGATASLQYGSFQTTRASFGARYLGKSGVFGALTAFVDSSKNDYDVTVQVPDSLGRLHDATVPRFHDRYSARGAIADLGVVNRPWAQRLILRAFYSDYHKELQNNPLQTIPYGAVDYGESLVGASLLASQDNALGKNVDVDAVASLSHRTTDFDDTSSKVYDWYGQVIHIRPQPGEIDGNPHLVTIWRDSVFGRLGVAWRIARGHTVRVNSSASLGASHGVSRVGILPGARDPLASPRTLFKLVSGLEHQLDALEGRLENVAFVKHYLLHAASEELLTGQSYVPVRIDDDTAGAGDGLRVKILGSRLYAKASYEYATRLPNQTEVFGDGILIQPNGTLSPERSHNANLGLQADFANTRAGSFDAELNGFLRYAQNLIVLLGNLRDFSYQNVLSARSLGVEGVTRWRSPRDFVALEASVTWQDVRNDSAEGPFAHYQGDRVPSQPWLFASFAARGQYRSLLHQNDELALTWRTRYVHEFFRDWESIGAPQYKLVVDAQLSHSLSLAYTLRGGGATTSFAFDVDNLTNERLYDVYGVQRPGRAFYGKTTVEF